MRAIYHIIGQIMGLFSGVICIITPLFKKKWQMLINTALINLFMALNLIFIGELGSAVWLCATAVVQCFFSLYHYYKGSNAGKFETVSFFLLYLVLGFVGLFTSPNYVPGINFRNILELLPIAGSLMSMCFVFVKNEQRARWFLLFTCSIWTVYTAIVGASSFFAEFITLLTTIFSIIKYRKKSGS